MPLLFTRDDEAGEDGNDRPVHGHRDADLVQRDVVEEDLHVLDAVDRHARLAHVALDPRMIAVVAAVRGEVERDRNALLTRGQVAAVEGVRFLGRRKARILADRPGAACVHRRLHPASERRNPWCAAHMPQVQGVGFGVERLDEDAFQRLPCQFFEGTAAHFLLG